MRIANRFLVFFSAILIIFSIFVTSTVTAEEVLTPEHPIKTTIEGPAERPAVFFNAAARAEKKAAKAAQPAAGKNSRSNKVTVKKTIKVLLIGNSLTSSNNHCLARYLCKLSARGGYQVSVTEFAYNGEKLETYAAAKTTRGKKLREKIRSKKWDYIVFQQHTDRAIAKKNATKRSLKTLNSYIKKHAPQAQILLDSTWAYDYTRYLYGRSYFHSVQQKLMNKNYKECAKAIKAKVIFSGDAFDAYRRKYNRLRLYKWDGNHATNAGYYLNACCIYAAIFGKSPCKLKYYGGLTKKDALQLQKCAADANGK